MSQKKKNLPQKSTLLRTQSYIINGEPNPLSDILREKYFSKYYNFGKGKAKKLNLKKYKKYINQVKKHKKKLFSCDKKNKSIIIKIAHKKEINNKENLNKNNYKENEKNLLKDYSNKKVNLLINNNKENKDFGNEKKMQKNILVNKFQNMKISIPFHMSNQEKEKNNIIHNYDSEYNLTNESIKNNNINIPKLIKNNNNNNIYSNDIRHYSRYNSFDNNNNETYNKIYTQNLIKKSNNIFSLKKDKLFTNKILSNYDEEFNDINCNKNNYKLSNESNYYTKRENYNAFRNFKNNITKEILKPIKKFTKENSMINTNLIAFLDDNKTKSTKINKIPKIHKFINSYNSVNEMKKKYVKYNNYLSDFCKYIKERHNKFSLSIRDYNNKTYEEEKYRPKSYKSISNKISSMHDELETNKFIKELNRNNKLYKSNKNIMFSFNNEKNGLNDEFFSPNKTHRNNEIFSKKDIKNYFDYKELKQRKLNCIKKNKTFNIYRRNNYSGINFKSCINIISFINNNKCKIIHNKIIFPPNDV